MHHWANDLSQSLFYIGPGSIVTLLGFWCADCNSASDLLPPFAVVSALVDLLYHGASDLSQSLFRIGPGSIVTLLGCDQEGHTNDQGAFFEHFF